jgi:hypothetical protein
MYDNNPLSFLSLPRLPARVDYHGAAILLNFEVSAIKALVEMGHLKPAGNPKGSEHKYFPTKTILRHADDEKWVSDATRAVSKYWAEKNSRRGAKPKDDESKVSPPKRRSAAARSSLGRGKRQRISPEEIKDILNQPPRPPESQ